MKHSTTVEKILTLIFIGVQVVSCSDWVRWGKSLNNDRFAHDETEISKSNVEDLGLLWSFEAFGSVSTTPTVFGDVVYITDWGGGVHALDKNTGDVIWSRTVIEFTQYEDDHSRSAPLILDDMLIIGSYRTPVLLALDRFTGEQIWQQWLLDILCSRITMSPVAANGLIYIGLSNFSRDPMICPGARGAVLALDPRTGEIVWEWYPFPESYLQKSPRDQLTGVAIWGMTMAFDLALNTVYVPTGNIYWLPQEIYDCEKMRAPRDPPCIPDDVVTDSIAALNMTSGEMLWFKSLIDYEAWNLGCQSDRGECPDPEGPDADFAQGPIVMDIEVDGRRVKAIGAGQKNGMFWALDRTNGDVLWSQKVGPHGLVGGLEFGSAYDGERIYVASANSDRAIFHLRLNREIYIATSHWAALDPNTGDVLWETPSNLTGDDARAMSPLTVSNGLVYAGETDFDGHMYIFDAENGDVKWQYNCTGPVGGGPSISDGIVLWGCGYKNDLASNGEHFLAFKVGAGDSGDTPESPNSPKRATSPPSPRRRPRNGN